MDLAEKKCVPCEGGVPSMSNEDATKLLDEVPDWQLLEEDVLKLQKKFKFKNFKEAITFVNKVADLAESEGHHPDFKINWNKVTLTLSTHAIKGLSENDFIMAAKINAFQQPMSRIKK